MTVQSPSATDPVFLAHLAVFGVAAVACFASAVRARRIADPDTRRGFVALLVASGAWASAHLGFLLVPGAGLKVAFYLAGLIVGLSAVGPWLYVCSAYTGRTLHRNRAVRRAAVAVFLALVLVKLTNPLHHLYFTTAWTNAPFPHLAVRHGIFHWLVMGLSYALATVGYFMLLERFMNVSYDTRPLLALIALTGLPIVLDVIGLSTPYLVDITYEPVGVAAFAVGVLFIYLDRFRAVQLSGGRDEPVIVVDSEDRIRDHNDEAADLFPELGDGDEIGEPLAQALPALSETLAAETSIVELERAGVTRYYRLTTTAFGADQTQLGRSIGLTDVTHREQYRQELERQNQRLEQFASMVSHDLRNPLNVADGRLELAREEHDNEHLAAVAEALDRMESLIEDLLSLARQGQPIDDTEPVALSSVAEQCWRLVDSRDAELNLEADTTFVADVERLRQLLENLFRNAIEHGGDAVRIEVSALENDAGFYVADDGPGIPESDREAVFESGFTTSPHGTGFGLAIVSEIVRAHGWTIEVTESAGGGARFEIRGVEVVE